VPSYRQIFWKTSLAIGSFLAIIPSQLCSQDAPSCGYLDWFAVQRAQLQGKQLSSLCEGELNASEDHRPLAERELNAVIDAAPGSTKAYEAHSSLVHFYLRVGRFQDAELHIRAMLAIKPAAPDLVNLDSLFKLLASHPDMAVLNANATATVSTHVIDGNVFVPVTVNGLAKSYMLDTGLDLSLMSETEAAHLSLKTESSTSRMNDISGATGPELKVAVVDDLIVGATHLRNVPFLVVSDTNGAFLGIPPDQHGILGIQPLVALGRLGFQTDGSLTIAGKDKPPPITSPLLFAGTSPLTQIRYRGKPLTVTLDTGATQTTLNPPFAKLYPKIVRDGKRQSHNMNGLSGTTVQQSISVPHLVLWFGRDVEMAQAIVLLNQTTGSSAWAAANLGYDLLQQAKPFTLNFANMVVEFPSHR
jgi:predicted aspartyl protease